VNPPAVTSSEAVGPAGLHVFNRWNVPRLCYPLGRVALHVVVPGAEVLLDVLIRSTEKLLSLADVEAPRALQLWL